MQKIWRAESLLNAAFLPTLPSSGSRISFPKNKIKFLKVGVAENKKCVIVAPLEVFKAPFNALKRPNKWENLITQIYYMLALIISFMVLGISLAAVEIILPGTIWGSIGAGFFITSVVLAYKEGGLSMGATTFGIGLFFLCAVLIIGIKTFPKMNWAKKYFTEAARRGRSVIVHDGEPIIGKAGVVTKKLKPVGLIEIEGIRYKAVTDKGVAKLDVGSKIIVVGHSLAKLVVRAA